MGWKLPSYFRLERCCNAECLLGSLRQPCWGRVIVADELYGEELSEAYWSHRCEGHSGQYMPSPYPEDQGAEAVEDDG